MTLIEDSEPSLTAFLPPLNPFLIEGDILYFYLGNEAEVHSLWGVVFPTLSHRPFLLCYTVGENHIKRGSGDQIKAIMSSGHLGATHISLWVVGEQCWGSIRVLHSPSPI